MHVKAAITSNRLLKHFKIQKKYDMIKDGTKIKYVYLRENPLYVNVVAVKGYNDPKQIIDLITEYVDHNAMFENELSKKLQSFYDALQWGNVPTNVNQNAAAFFSF